MSGASEIEALLDATASAIARADFPLAADLALQIEAVLEAGGLSAAPEMLERLQRKADRNAAHLAAARRGIRSARRRVEELRRALSGLSTYDGKGRLSGLTAGGPVAGRF